MEPKKHPRCDGNTRRKLCSYDCDLCFSRSVESSDNGYLFDTETNGVAPRQVFKNTEKEYMFYCEVCDHRFPAITKNVCRAGCPFCATPTKRLCEKEDCIICPPKSFLASDRHPQWHPDNDKTPRQVPLNSHTKYKFTCDNENCKHTFWAGLNKVSSGTWCPHCGPTRKICDDPECPICRKTSFAKNDRAEFWSDKNEGEPKDYTTGTSKKFLFNCPTCPHEISIALNKITGSNRWCPYCAVPSKKLCTDENCDFCYLRSFAAYEKAVFWSANNTKTPRECIMGSHDKYLFDCNLCGEEFEMSLESASAGKWCSCQKKKTEAKLLKWLKSQFPGQLTYQPKFDWCKNSKTNRQFPFDYLVEIPGDIPKIIELDGAQHFRQVHNWAPPEQTQARDRYKERCANENGYTVIRISQEDVLYDRIEWEPLLLQAVRFPYPGPEIVELYNGIIETVTHSYELNFVETVAE